MVVDGSDERFDEVSNLLALVGFHAGAEICHAVNSAPAEV